MYNGAVNGKVSYYHYHHQLNKMIQHTIGCVFNQPHILIKKNKLYTLMPPLSVYFLLLPINIEVFDKSKSFYIPIYS